MEKLATYHDLPYELHLLVTALLQKEDLKSYALVCRRCCDMAREFIFKNIHLKLDFHSDRTHSDRMESMKRRYHDFIHLSHNIYPLVQSLQITCIGDCARETNFFESVLPVMENLHNISLHAIGLLPITWSLSSPLMRHSIQNTLQCSKLLTRVSLWRVEDLPRGILFDCSSLEEISLFHVRLLGKDFVRDEQVAETRSGPRLKSLAITTSEEEDITKWISEDGIFDLSNLRTFIASIEGNHHYRGIRKILTACAASLEVFEFTPEFHENARGTVELIPLHLGALLNLRILRLSALVTPASLETRLRQGPFPADSSQRRWVQETIMKIQSRFIEEISIHTTAYMTALDPDDPVRQLIHFSRGFDLSCWSFLDELVVGPYLDRLRKVTFYIYYRPLARRMVTFDWTVLSRSQKTFPKLCARGIFRVLVTNSLTWHILDLLQRRT